MKIDTPFWAVVTRDGGLCLSADPADKMQPVQSFSCPDADKQRSMLSKVAWPLEARKGGHKIVRVVLTRCAVEVDPALPQKSAEEEVGVLNAFERGVLDARSRKSCIGSLDD